jgi:hypothetical protein
MQAEKALVAVFKNPPNFYDVIIKKFLSVKPAEFHVK